MWFGKSIVEEFDLPNGTDPKLVCLSGSLVGLSLFPIKVKRYREKLVK
jgi:hypothetical protein